MNPLLDGIKQQVKRLTRRFARLLHALSGGTITPNTLTLFGLAMHVLVAWWVAAGSHSLAALGLVLFGLLDSVDGDLARLQGTTSTKGMLLDATTDRMKEVMLYTGAAWFLAGGAAPREAVIAVAACGASLLVSYVKAKGEMAVLDQRLKPNEINRLFGDGLMRFEVRMFVLFVGLAAGLLFESLMLIASLSLLTAVRRLTRISKKLEKIGTHV